MRRVSLLVTAVVVLTGCSHEQALGPAPVEAPSPVMTHGVPGRPAIIRMADSSSVLTGAVAIRGDSAIAYPIGSDRRLAIPLADMREIEIRSPEIGRLNGILTGVAVGVSLSLMMHGVELTGLLGPLYGGVGALIGASAGEQLGHRDIFRLTTATPELGGPTSEEEDATAVPPPTAASRTGTLPGAPPGR